MGSSPSPTGPLSSSREVDMGWELSFLSRQPSQHESGSPPWALTHRGWSCGPWPRGSQLGTNSPRQPRARGQQGWDGVGSPAALPHSATCRPWGVGGAALKPTTCPPPPRVKLALAKKEEAVRSLRKQHEVGP